MPEQQKKKYFPNEITYRAGLKINVKSIKKKMRLFYDYKNLPVKQFSGGHVYLSACLEEMANELLKSAASNTVENITGLKTITRVTLKNGIVSKPDLEGYFYRSMSFFNQNKNYSLQPQIPTSELNAIMVKLDESLTLSNKGRSFLNYLLNYFFDDMCFQSALFLEGAKRSSLTPTFVSLALRSSLSGLSGNLYNVLTKRASKSSKAVAKYYNHKKDGAQNDENNDENNDDNNDDSDNDDSDNDGDNDDDNDGDDDNDDNDDDDSGAESDNEVFAKKDKKKKQMAELTEDDFDDDSDDDDFDGEFDEVDKPPKNKKDKNKKDKKKKKKDKKRNKTK